MKRLFRRLRGVLGNALIWGTVWLLCGSVIGILPLLRGDIGLATVLSTGIFAGSLGAGFGSVFAAFVAGNFRGKTVDELSPGRFAVGGALVTIPISLLLSAASQSWKGWIFFGDLILPVGVTAALGGLTAFGIVKLAQRALPPGAAVAELEQGTASRLRYLAHKSD